MTALDVLPDELPAITIWQPWASLIIAGLKKIEFRDWPAPPRYRGRRIAIHAGARKMGRPDMRALTYRMQRDSGLTSCGARLSPDDLEMALDLVTLARALSHSAFIGTVLLGVPVRATELFVSRDLPPGETLDPNKWGWPMVLPERLPPVSASGHQGFFTMAVPEQWREASNVQVDH